MTMRMSQKGPQAIETNSMILSVFKAGFVAMWSSMVLDRLKLTGKRMYHPNVTVKSKVNAVIQTQITLTFVHLLVGCNSKPITPTPTC